MERKLSQKATKMRQRFTFSRNGQGRHRASTMNSSAGAATSTSHSRPRSSTSPVSSNPSEIAWYNADPTRHYDFTDEPGYFRPASPFIDRQEIDEEQEDDMKHACALLVHSIERGLPMWPSSCTDLRPNTGTGSTVKASVSEPQSKCQGQGAHVSSGALGNESPVCKEMHDSGVAFSNQSTARLGIPGQNGMSGTAASAGTGRFYGRQLSTTPLEKKPFDRGRARGQSFATDVSSVPSRPRSSSPVLFPYSPPQADAQWVHGEDEDNTTPPDNLLERNAFLGAEGITWLRASLDIHRLGKHEYTTYPTESKDQVDVSSVPVSGPQPRRFYSTRRLPSEKIFQPHEWADDVASSRAPSSVRSLSFDEEKRDMSIHDWAHRNLHDHYSSKGLDNPEAIYSVVMPGAQPRHRRKRASQLFKKLVGIRRKEDSHGSVENKRVDRAVATAA